MTHYKYYDIHTHSVYHHHDVLSVFNIHERYDEQANDVVSTMGLHPWYLQNADNEFELLQTNANNNHVLAIGECGLDKVCDTDWATQLVYFRKQIQLAHSCTKPLIIHCVRAFEEVIDVLHTEQVKVPVVFHGYNKSSILAHRLIDHGYFLSFGAAILIDNAKIEEVIKTLPTNRIFVETDNSGKSIIDIYHRLAEIRNTDTETIILQLQQNFKSVFEK